MGLAIYLKKGIEHYYGLSITELKEVAYEYALKVKVKVPQAWADMNMAGRQWYYGFMLRHKEFSLRTPEQTSLNRVKDFCRENAGCIFQQFGSSGALIRGFIHMEHGRNRVFNRSDQNG